MPPHFGEIEMSLFETISKKTKAGGYIKGVVIGLDKFLAVAVSCRRWSR